MNARAVTLIIGFTVALPLRVAADDAMRPVEIYDGLVTLDMPEHWNEIPADVLEYFSLKSAEESGGLVVEIYQHGFRPGDPEADFAPPQILFQIKESGRLNYRQFIDLPPIEVVRDHGAAQLDERKGPLLEKLRLNEVVFDRENFSIHVATTLDLIFEGKVLVTSVSFLTERGVLTVHCYALISQHVAMKPVFDRILESVRIDDSIRYRPRLGDRMPPRPALIAYAIAFVLAIMVFVVHLLQRRRRTA